uniref:Ion transport domain-containing protein n=1 Tax=Strongyloides stercoralis TaxID=6248 RepID=A0AAF5CXU5_STRER
MVKFNQVEEEWNSNHSFDDSLYFPLNSQSQPSEMEEVKITKNFLNSRTRIKKLKERIIYIFDYRKYTKNSECKKEIINWNVLEELQEKKQWDLLKHPYILNFINENLIYTPEIFKFFLSFHKKKDLTDRFALFHYSIIDIKKISSYSLFEESINLNFNRKNLKKKGKNSYHQVDMKNDGESLLESIMTNSNKFLSSSNNLLFKSLSITSELLEYKGEITNEMIDCKEHN